MCIVFFFKLLKTEKLWPKMAKRAPWNFAQLFVHTFCPCIFIPLDSFKWVWLLFFVYAFFLYGSPRFTNFKSLSLARKNYSVLKCQKQYEDLIFKLLRENKNTGPECNLQQKLHILNNAVVTFQIWHASVCFLESENEAMTPLKF